jgi:hypothetical protein
LLYSTRNLGAFWLRRWLSEDRLFRCVYWIMFPDYPRSHVCDFCAQLFFLDSVVSAGQRNPLWQTLRALCICVVRRGCHSGSSESRKDYDRQAVNNVATVRLTFRDTRPCCHARAALEARLAGHPWFIV